MDNKHVEPQYKKHARKAAGYVVDALKKQIVEEISNNPKVREEIHQAVAFHLGRGFHTQVADDDDEWFATEEFIGRLIFNVIYEGTESF